MIRSARYRNYGPMRGCVVMLRPEVAGLQRWTVQLTIERMEGGERRIDERSMTAASPIMLGAMRDLVFAEIRESIGETDDCAVEMAFYVPQKKRKRR